MLFYRFYVRAAGFPKTEAVYQNHPSMFSHRFSIGFYMPKFFGFRQFCFLTFLISQKRVTIRLSHHEQILHSFRLFFLMKFNLIFLQNRPTADVIPKRSLFGFLVCFLFNFVSLKSKRNESVQNANPLCRQ